MRSSGTYDRVAAEEEDKSAVGAAHACERCWMGAGTEAAGGVRRSGTLARRVKAGGDKLRIRREAEAGRGRVRPRDALEAVLRARRGAGRVADVKLAERIRDRAGCARSAVCAAIEAGSARRRSERSRRSFGRTPAA